jgi:hypothetical protein
VVTPSSPAERDGEHQGLAIRLRMPTHATGAVVLVTGLWVAVSPRFLPLRPGGTDAAADVIIGLLVAGIAALALVSRRHGARFTGLVLGVWAVLASSFMLDERASIAAPMCWSNTWSGAMLALLALASLKPATRRDDRKGM